MEVVGTRSGPGAQASYVKLPECPWSPLLFHCLLSPSLYLRSHGKSLAISDRGREDSGLVSRWFCKIHRYHLKGDSFSMTALLQTIPEGQWVKEMFSVGRTLGSTPGCTLCWEAEMHRYATIYQCQWFGWMARDLENPIGNLVTQKFGSEVCG